MDAADTLPGVLQPSAWLQPTPCPRASASQLESQSQGLLGMPLWGRTHGHFLPVSGPLAAM